MMMLDLINIIGIIVIIITFPVPILVRLKRSMWSSKGVHLHLLMSHSFSSSTDTLRQKSKMRQFNNTTSDKISF